MDYSQESFFPTIYWFLIMFREIVKFLPSYFIIKLS